MDKTSLALKNEKDLLAEIIVNDQDASLIVTSINPEYFIDEKNKNIFLAIKQLADSRSTINKQNILAILNQDKKLNFDDASDYIRQMITVADVINISESIDTLKLNYVQKMINSFGKSLSVASISPAGSVDKIQYWIDEMTTYLNVLDNSTTFTTLSQELRNVVKETENRLSDKDDDRNVISTGFASLDEKVSINRNSMVILAGTPGAGKTAFALSIAMNLAEELREKNKTLGEKVKKQVVLFFSLEMASSELVERVIQNKKGISVNGRNMEFLKNKLSDLKDLEEELSNDPLPILFIDKKLTVEEIFALTVKEKDKYDVKLIIIDYIQHILPSPYLGKNAKEFEQVSHAFKKLLELKSKIKRPIIGLSQLTKESSYEQFKPMKKSKDDSEIKSNEPKRLKVADLASTSEIGKGANIILALTQYPLENSSRSLQIVKNRAGVSTESCSNFEEANIKLKFDGKKMSFTEISEESSKN